MNNQTKNIAIVQKLYAAFAKRDINEILSMLSSDVVWEEPANPFNPAAGKRCGKEGFLEWLRIPCRCRYRSCSWIYKVSCEGNW